jgi:hypothetical protein
VQGKYIELLVRGQFTQRGCHKGTPTGGMVNAWDEVGAGDVTMEKSGAYETGAHPGYMEQLQEIFKKRAIASS